jgi:hypothetical protein
LYDIVTHLMTYYDELGLTPAAGEEDIRKAHRILSKLLHPDQQTDPAVRRAAEIQMIRLNGMVDTLLDPERRARYDLSLAPPKPVLIKKSGLKHSIGILLATIASAVGLTLMAVWLLAGDLMHFRPSAPAVAKIADVTLPFPAAEPAASSTDPAPRAKHPKKKGSRRSTVRGSLPGVWTSTSAPKGTSDAPEYVELQIHSKDNTLYGEYASRYGVSPQVTFAFRGGHSGATYEWNADDGSRGTVDLKLLTAQSLQVKWRVTEFGARKGLGAGTAVLIKRRDSQ